MTKIVLLWIQEHTMALCAPSSPFSAVTSTINLGYSTCIHLLEMENTS